MAISNHTYCRNFDHANEVRDFQAHGHIDIVALENDTIIGRGVFEPGWKWSQDVKPLVETESCEATHTGYCVSGSMTIRMNNGEEFIIRAGEAFHIPPGHDAWVDGKERCVLIDTAGFKNYALGQQRAA